MKIYVSADIDGITGTTHWDETDDFFEVLRLLKFVV